MVTAFFECFSHEVHPNHSSFPIEQKGLWQWHNSIVGKHKTQFLTQKGNFRVDSTRPQVFSSLMHMRNIIFLSLQGSVTLSWSLHPWNLGRFLKVSFQLLSPPPVFLAFSLSFPVVLYFVSFRLYTLMEGILLLWIYESKCILQRIPGGIICPLTLFNLYYWHIQGCLTPTRKKKKTQTTHINLQKCVLTCLLKMKMDVLWEITWVLL